MGYIYETTNLINGTKYIGLSSKKEFDESYLGSGLILIKAVKKYGRENFEVKPLEYHDSKEKLIEAERRVIKERKANISDKYYNICEGGQWGNVVSGMSKERKEAMSEKISKKRKAWFNNNPEQRELYAERMREMATGKKLTEEDKARLQKAQREDRQNNPEKYKDAVKRSHEIRKKNGTNPWLTKKHPWIGREHSTETKEKIANTIKSKRRINKASLLIEDGEEIVFDNCADLRMYLRKNKNFTKEESWKVNDKDFYKGYKIKKHKVYYTTLDENL